MIRRKTLKVLVIAAFVLAFLGICAALLDLEAMGLHVKNDGYVGAAFSLSGILLYFVALMYQIQEYKLQVSELRKSVEAQTASSRALDEQRKLLLEQNAHNLIFGMIDRFNEFKDRNNIQEVIKHLILHYRGEFAKQWKLRSSEGNMSKKELNEKFAHDIQNIFAATITTWPDFHLVKSYVQLAYNILYIIDVNKSNVSQDYSPAFLSLLNPLEKITLYLANLSELDMPFTDKLVWGYHPVKGIIDEMAKHDEKIDFSSVDCRIMMEEFQRIKGQS